MFVLVVKGCVGVWAYEYSVCAYECEVVLLVCDLWFACGSTNNQF